jgi:NTP pyrophosphatase (non-canonical NTP hydrolase)
MRDDDYFERLLRNVAGLNAKFPGGDEPFQMMTRVCEEAGELAKAVNHVEGSGIKIEKYGPPDRPHLAEEIHHLLRADGYLPE